MAYVGNPIDTQNTFQSLVGKRFNGDGSTTDFTLDVAPSSTLDIEVFVGNVRQDPNSAYTVSGTTLSFTGAPPSGTNNIYVVHQAKSVGTIDPPANSVGVTQLNLSDGSNGQVLQTNGSGTISFATVDTSSATDSFTITGSTPTLTIGDAGAEDTKIVFDGNAQDYYIGLDDSADDLIIGKGSTVGTTPIVSMIDTGETKITSTNSGETTPTFNIHTTGNANGAYANLLFTSAGNTTGASIKGLQSSSGNDADLLFFVNNSGTATQAMRIRFDGNVGIGTGADSTQLKVEHDTSGEKVMQLRSTHASNPRGMEMQYPNATPDNTSNDNLVFSFEDDNTSRIKITSDGDINNHDGTYGTLSDSRIKDNITDANSQWDDIKAIKVRNYKKKDDVRDYADKAPTHIGVIAQELETSGMNGLVKETEPSKGEIQSDSSFGTLYQDGDTLPDGKEIGDIKEIKSQVKSVKYSILYMKAIKALQEAQTRIETLEAKVKTLEEA